MHLCPGNVVAIGRAVVYYIRATHTFSAEIKCRHCRYIYIYKQYAKHINDRRSLRTKATFSCESIHAQETGC